MDKLLERYAPHFQADHFSDYEKWLISPFFSNLDKSVYLALIYDTELAGALMSRASRAKGDLRRVFLEDYIKPIACPKRKEKGKERDSDEVWAEKLAQAREMKTFIRFLHKHPFEKIFSNKRARAFYTKWLAGYGDDSIAQMTGMYIVFAGISQVTIKHFEDMRIGIAPIEQSTRYVPYDSKVNGRYKYYSDPDLTKYGLLEQFEAVNDKLFDTYSDLIPKLKTWLAEKYPNEDANTIEKKAFDSLRGLLPMGTLSQVAFYGNAQAFEHLINRSLEHPLGEIRWAASRAKEELSARTPALFRRVNSGSETGANYQKYLVGKKERLRDVSEAVAGLIDLNGSVEEGYEVKIVDHDQLEKVITAMIFDTSDYHKSWDDTLDQVIKMTEAEKDMIITEYLSGRDERWMKAGRAFEMCYVTIEIMMNIGGWRDLHRHRMLTQFKQSFSCYHGYDVPEVVVESGLDDSFRAALDYAVILFVELAGHSGDLAQYVACLAHLMRFVQHKNLRECLWEGELRTTPACHPDYRRIEQLIFKELEKKYPLITKHSLVDMNDYDFARRGDAKKIKDKEERLLQSIQ